MQEAKPPRVFAFIDSQNLNLGVQKMGWKMDWRKFRKFLADQYGVNRAYMFIGYIPENEDLYEQMHDSGFAVVLKPTFDLTKPRPEVVSEVAGASRTENNVNQDSPAQLNSGHPGQASQTAPSPDDKKPVKGNIDAELVLWAMKELSNYEQAVIVSGDGDFYCLVEYLESKGRLKHLLTPSGQYSQLYNRYENYIVRLDQFRRQLAYYTRRKH